LVGWTAYTTDESQKKGKKNGVNCICFQMRPTQPKHNLLLYYLDDILILKDMGEPTMLWIVPCTGSPYKNIFHIFEQASMDMIAEVFNCTSTSILMAQKRTSDKLSPLL
jgi:hypothetical protein